MVPLAEKHCFWLSDFSLSPAGLRCGKPDALGNVPHDHGKEKAISYNLQGAAICAALPDIGLRGGADSTPEGIKSLPAAAGSAPAPPQPVPEMPLPDVRSGEDISPAERAKLDKEVESYAQEMEAFWKAKADARDWDSVRANLEVYALAGEKVTEDPRRTEAYRDLVWEGLKVEPGPTRPGLTAADVAAIKEVVRRKAAGFWAEGTTRTTVRKFAHDCIPTGPPVSSQPHALKGEAAQWVDDRLEEEVQRGQLVRGPSAWGSAPFPTKEMPNHKRARKRRLVVDYRRVNARVKRSTYYCRRSTDVLAAAVGSIWYTFVDAVSGFNQIRNTKRAREVLAIVARSGKYLPVGLTFGPVNGPDDFNFVVDRAYAPGKGRRLRYTKEWIAYVDDLTVRTGRVVDGKFYTDSAADQAVREACAKGSSQAAPQSPESAMEALGFKPKPPPHDAARSDTNHPTRSGTFRGPESGGFQGCGFKGFGAGVVRGLFAALWKGARGGSAALVCDARGATAVFCSNARGVQFSVPALLPEERRSFVIVVSASAGRQPSVYRSGRSEVRRCNARVPCVPPRTLEASAPAAANLAAFSVALRTVLIFPLVPGAMGGSSRWAESQKGGQKGGDGHRAPRPGSRGGGSSRREPTLKGGGRQAPRGRSDWSPRDWNRGGGSSRRDQTPRGRGQPSHRGRRERMSPGEDLQRKIVRALRHGEFGFRGSFERGGYLSIDSLKEAFGGGEDVWSEAFRLDRRAKKTRLDYGRPGYLRALQGHSSDCGHELPYMAAPLDASAVADLQRSHGKYIYHGTDIHVVEGIVSRGLLPGGGPGGRLANHFVVGTMPTQWSDARGFRRGSNTVVQCDLEVLGRAGVRLFQGADGVLLADTVPPEAIFRILGADNKRGAYTEVLAEIGTDRMLHLVRDFRAEAVEAAAAAMDDSAAAAGSADVAGPAAPGEGAGADEADTEESSSGSDLPDTTAPAAAKAEERSGAAEAAHSERSAAGDDVDMGDVMSEAAASDPTLTIGDLVDKTSEKLKFMAGYMEGAACMVRAEGLESARAGAEHRRVLEHAEDLLRRLGGVPRAAGCRGGCGRFWRPALGECGA